jgi:hypothetical protein
MGVFITWFFYQDVKADVYLFYDHARYLDNIFYDIINMLTTTIFTWYASRWKRNIFMPFFIVSLVSWALYFTIYKQGASLIEIPILILLIIAYNTKK